MTYWPEDPYGDMAPILEASIATLEKPVTVTLTPADRCDNCSARANHRLTKGELTLDLCTHHWRKHGEAMVEKDWNLLAATVE
jgi:hypothetical protein